MALRPTREDSLEQNLVVSERDLDIQGNATMGEWEADPFCRAASTFLRWTWMKGGVVMRKTLCAVPILMMLLCLALPAWGETPAAPVVPWLQSRDHCLASATPGSTTLPGVIPPPEFKTVVCGGCSDSVCRNHPPGYPCTASTGEPGTCTGFQDGNDYEYCPENTPRPSGYRCVCMTLSE